MKTVSKVTGRIVNENRIGVTMQLFVSWSSVCKRKHFRDARDWRPAGQNLDYALFLNPWRSVG